MKELTGVSVSTGIAIGEACFYSENVDPDVPHYLISEKDIEKELFRLEEAFDRARKNVKKLSLSKEVSGSSESVIELIKAHLLIIEDGTLRDKTRRLVSEDHKNAERAVDEAFGEYVEKLSGENFHFADIAHDVEDVKNRVLASFNDTQGKFSCPVGEKKSVIVVAKKLTPSVVLNIPKERALAFVTEEGGLTTHASILARTYSVPVIFGIDVFEHITCGSRLIVDGTMGIVYLDPDPETEEHYRTKLKKLSERAKVCAVNRGKPARTQGGRALALKINVTSPEEVELARDFEHDGIGLLRTEFLFKGKSRPPSFNEQVKVYKQIFDLAGEKPISVRLLDIAADKTPPYMVLPEQDNPDLGIRGARAAEIFRSTYLDQIKAVLHAARDSRVGFLYPMVSDLSDIESFRFLVKEAEKELRQEKLKFLTDIREGIMIETPAAALNAEVLMEEVDFANLGTNDLLQYTLAASRGNRFVETRYHIMHPSLIRLMSIAANAGEKVGKEVCLCGEIAFFEHYYPVFLSAGIRSFSVPVARYEQLKCDLLYQKALSRDDYEEFLSLNHKKMIDEFFSARISA